MQRSLRQPDEERYAAAGLLPYIADKEAGGVFLLMGRNGDNFRRRGRPKQLVLLVRDRTHHPLGPRVFTAAARQPPSPSLRGSTAAPRSSIAGLAHQRLGAVAAAAR